MSRYLNNLYNFIMGLNDKFLSVVAFFRERPALVALLIILLVILIILFILMIIYKKLKGKYLAKLIYKREFSTENVYAGETVTLTETIFNPTFFPLFSVDVEEYFLGGLWLDGAKPNPDVKAGAEQEPVLSRFTLLPFMQTKRHHQVFCEKRGHYQISTVRIYRKNDPLFINAPAEIYVYPPLVDPMINSFPVSCLLGEYTSKRRLIQDPFSFAGIREYRFGDSMNAINYKATARHPVITMSDIMVNVRDYCTGRLFMIYQNFHLQNAGKGLYDNYEKLMEYGLSVSSALIRDAVHNGCKVGFSANCPVDNDSYIRYPMQSSEEHYKQIMHGFAAMRLSDGISIKQLLQMDIDDGLNNAEIIFLTTYMDDEIDDRLRMLKQYSNAVTVITLSEEDLVQ